jgi:hypothetical protein
MPATTETGLKIVGYDVNVDKKITPTKTPGTQMKTVPAAQMKTITPPIKSPAQMKTVPAAQMKTVSNKQAPR